MKKVFLVASICALMVGCATVQNESPNLGLAKQLVHCGLVADNLAESDVKYKQYASTFIGAAGALLPNQSVVQLMMEDQGAPLIAKMQQSEKVTVVEGCQTLLYSNMDKVSGAMSQPKSR